MRRLATVVAILMTIVLVAVGALYAVGRVADVGPFAPGVPTSWLFVAISRNGEDGDSREIEVLDLATGERPPLITTDDRVFELALTHDRRTLLVGTSNGRIFEYDALHGVFLDEIKLSTNGDVRRIVVLPDNRQVVAVSTAAAEAIVSLVDVGARRETATLGLGNRLIGRSVAGKDVLLAASDRTSVEQVLGLGLDPLVVRSATVITPIGPPTSPRTAGPALELTKDGSIVALSPVGLRLLVLPPNSSDRIGTDIPVSFRPIQLVPGFDGDLILSADSSTIHFCIGTSQRAERYVATRERLLPQRVGTDCGRFGRIGDGRIYLAVRAAPELREIDPASGGVMRTLALAGFPQRVAY
jgi:hypothetical protein